MASPSVYLTGPERERAWVAAYSELKAAFDDRNTALTRSADECISLTNERDALRDALRGVLSAEIVTSARAIDTARQALQYVDLRESRKSTEAAGRYRDAPRPTSIIDGPRKATPVAASHLACPAGGVCTNPALCANLGQCCAKALPGDITDVPF